MAERQRHALSPCAPRALIIHQLSGTTLTRAVFEAPNTNTNKSIGLPLPQHEPKRPFLAELSASSRCEGSPD
jgi:hypothetical protein